ncbi:MAG: hypothetical protein KTR26_09695 [Flammeovirgaceae bacterium]|nr:hypothetical protein [Flammeovirgaceae bacterium]
MIVNNQKIGDIFIPEKCIVIKNIESVLEKEFNICEGFNEITIYEKESIILETNAVRRLCEEDKGLAKSYWIGTKKTGLVPGEINWKKMVVIANLDFDVPICLDFQNDEKNPEIIWLSGKGGWEKICDHHQKFLKILGI